MVRENGHLRLSSGCVCSFVEFLSDVNVSWGWGNSKGTAVRHGSRVHREGDIKESQEKSGRVGNRIRKGMRKP